MKARRSEPPTPMSNAAFVAGIALFPPVLLGLVRDTLERGEFALIAVVALAAAGLTYLISWAAYRRR